MKTEPLGGIWRGQPATHLDVSPAQPLGGTVVLSSAHCFESDTAIAAYHEAPDKLHRYGRDSSATASYAEQWLGNLYDVPALLFPSGMAAIAAVLQLGTAGSRHTFLTTENYRKTASLAQRESTHVSRFRGASTLREQMAQCSCAEKILLVESPANPHLRIVNLIALSEVAQEFGALTVWDATFAGLDNVVEAYKAMDIVVHSATKYIGGHDDLVAGACFARSELADRLFSIRSETSAVLDPMSSYLLTRSLTTYDMRLTQQLANTQLVLSHLEAYLDRGEINSLYYPGRYANGDQSELAATQLSHGGAVVSFDVAPPFLSNFSCAEGLRFLRLAPSFGSVRSLFEMPATMSHGGKSRQEIQRLGIEEGLVRLSIGVEPVDGIIADLDSLLSR